MRARKIIRVFSKTRVKLFPDFTRRHHLISQTYCAVLEKFFVIMEGNKVQSRNSFNLFGKSYSWNSWSELFNHKELWAISMRSAGGSTNRRTLKSEGIIKRITTQNKPLREKLNESYFIRHISDRASGLNLYPISDLVVLRTLHIVSYAGEVFGTRFIKLQIDHFFLVTFYFSPVRLKNIHKCADCARISKWKKMKLNKFSQKKNCSTQLRTQ